MTHVDLFVPLRQGIRMRYSAALLITLVVASGVLLGKEEAPRSLMNSELKIVPSSKQIHISTSPALPLEVRCDAGEDNFPGITLTPSRPWDLSGSGHVSAGITNTGKQPIDVCLRVDNEGDWQLSPYDSEKLRLEPGEHGVLEVIFGYSWGKQPGFKLNPASVVRVLVFAGKSAEAEQSFRIDSLEAAGPPGEKPPAKQVSPDDLRVAPAGGVIFDRTTKLDLKTQVAAEGGQAKFEGPALVLDVPESSHQASISIKPPQGRWDLRSYLELAVRLKNAGSTAVTPRVKVESNTGSTDAIAAAGPVQPGASAEVVVPFESATIWDGSDGTGNQFISDAASRVTVTVDAGAKGSAIAIESVVADVPKPHVPDWLGKRPPVEGEWVKTFDDEFDGRAIDASKWTLRGDNYYDQVSHFSSEDAIIGDGVVRLRYQKKMGYPNDDPSRKPATPYATGFLSSFDKWAQRYGYFESRMKLPSAPGLWPAFWMMPDRGPGAADRSDTAHGGMELDIMEHLTRWGPYRYNIAMHWDGYGKEHKALGSERIYFHPDADGYITAGVLWEPGLLTYYANGTPVLRWKNPRVSSVPGHFLFTLPSGGWDNNSLDDSRLPADFVIDYVRAWQRKDLASPRQQK